MKFWKSLSLLIEDTLPDWRDKFLSYKDLKKQLKLIHLNKDGEKNNPNKRPRLDPTDGGDWASTAGDNGELVTQEVNDFVKVLEDEIKKFNAFFVEKEEDYVIKLKELQDRLVKAEDSNEELMKVGTEIVDFHGEMVLLENYSALNYTGLVKILKKYDKRTGALIRVPFIQNVLLQPFFTTDVLNKLVKECETMLDQLFSASKSSVSPDATEVEEGRDSETCTENKEKLLKGPKELAEIEHMENMYVKLTQSALRVLKEIRSGSSTVDVFSLPPLQSSTLEDCAKIPVLEQVVK
ncbi:SPX domain-containing protein 1-like [Tripterygium wilfordii]|uniref:SPX domain-containing protein 1-like n=1 Tax=Tripterygium wilfordii TaxID=458696 RepID=A0A7J7DP83_TRIWF|nr:SPX domain-containing protein 2-like [Tripterygium wilfordii]KAF5748192.1 SPX domain-containing protein 1-like [Tripterygium wilfordii]